MRVYLEKVKGHYQGACFRFREGLSSGPVPLIFPPDGNQGSLIVGQTNRGWGSTGRKSYALERLDWTGKIPFEIHEMHAKSDGFEFTFTHDVDPATLANHDSYKLETYTYIYRAGYGSPEVDRTFPTITNIVLGDDKRSARLYIDRLQEGTRPRVSSRRYSFRRRPTPLAFGSLLYAKLHSLNACFVSNHVANRYNSWR